MARSIIDDIGGPNVAAALDAIAWSEIGSRLLSASDDGYNVFVGSTWQKPNLSDSYADHPMRLVTWIDNKGRTQTGSAWGRYQILRRYWPHYKKLLKLPDASPTSQDRYAVQQFKEQGAYLLLQQGRFVEAMVKCKNIWASLPGSGYGQHEQEIESLIAVYKQKGGTLA